jgi:hypothetical protein
MTAYRINLISAGSISLDSAFKHSRDFGQSEFSHVYCKFIHIFYFPYLSLYCLISLRFFQSSDANLCIMIKIIYRPCLFLTKTSQDLPCFHTSLTGYSVSQHAINHISRIYTLHTSYLKYRTEKRFPPLSRHKTNIRQSDSCIL